LKAFARPVGEDTTGFAQRLAELEAQVGQAVATATEALQLMREVLGSLQTRQYKRIREEETAIEGDPQLQSADGQNSAVPADAGAITTPTDERVPDAVATGPAPDLAAVLMPPLPVAATARSRAARISTPEPTPDEAGISTTSLAGPPVEDKAQKARKAIDDFVGSVDRHPPKAMSGDLTTIWAAHPIQGKSEATAEDLVCALFKLTHDMAMKDGVQFQTDDFQTLIEKSGVSSVMTLIPATAGVGGHDSTHEGRGALGGTGVVERCYAPGLRVDRQVFVRAVVDWKRLIEPR
jgi:hypothetical protein